MNNDELIKGGKGAPIGTRKTFGGREYIKTAEGYKYLGKGTGAKAKEHSAKSPNSAPDDKSSSPKKEETSLSDHASAASTEKLTGVAHDESASKEMREAAADELKLRDHGGKEVEGKEKEEASSEKKEPKSEEKKEPKKESAETKKKDPKTEDVEELAKLSPKDIKEASILAGKDGAAKLSEKEEGFSMKEVKKAPTPEDDEDDDINHKFAAFGRFAAGVIKGRMKSLIAYGSGGVGKTYTVTQELEKAGKKIYNPEKHSPGDSSYDYVKITGKMTPAAVYARMYEHNGKILLFDDCDSVLQDETSINLFKGALDTSGDGSIDWGSSKKMKDSDGLDIPQTFAFTGRAMFISNLDIDGKAGENLQPIISRGYGINLAMNPQKTMERIKFIAADKEGNYTNLKFPGIPKYTHEDMEEVFAYMDKHRDKAADLNVRTVGTLLAIKLDSEEANEKDWTRDAKYVYLRKSEEIDVFNGGLFKRKQDAINKSMGIDGRSIDEKKIDWCTVRKSMMKDTVTSSIEK